MRFYICIISKYKILLLGSLFNHTFHIYRRRKHLFSTQLTHVYCTNAYKLQKRSLKSLGFVHMKFIWTTADIGLQTSNAASSRGERS